MTGFKGCYMKLNFRPPDVLSARVHPLSAGLLPHFVNGRLRRRGSKEDRGKQTTKRRGISVQREEGKQG